MSNIFHFKQFSIEQKNAGMAVSTDGVLLGAWTDINQAQHILDIGTGTGLLALMCAQRNDKAHITAIDISQTAIDSATYNVANSPWQPRIQVELIDIGHFQPVKTFDTIICNPPYFHSGEMAKHSDRATARHSVNLSPRDLLISCKRLLSHQGKASFIFPFGQQEAFIALAKDQNLFPSRLCAVKTTPSKPYSRLLIELTHDHQCPPIDAHSTHLTIQNRQGDYTPEFIQLTQSFYLKM